MRKLVVRVIVLLASTTPQAVSVERGEFVLSPEGNQLWSRAGVS